MAKRAEEEIAKNLSKKSPIACAYFSLNAEPLDSNRNIVSIAFLPDVFPTNLFYSIQYKLYNNSRTKEQRDNPFIIKADFLPQFKEVSNKKGYVRVKSYEDLCELAKTNKHIQWLLDWTTLSPTMFEVVQGCPGLLFYFSVDVDKYVAHLREQGCNEPLSTMFIVPESSILINEHKRESQKLRVEETLERDRIRKREEYYRIKRGK